MQSLTIGARTGSYSGMPQARKFNIVFVGENHGAGREVVTTADHVIDYSGSAVTVQAN